MNTALTLSVLFAGLTFCQVDNSKKGVAPSDPKEPLAEHFEPKKAARFLDEVALGWTRSQKCSACHTNVPYMLARPLLSGGDHAAEKEIRKHLEQRVEGWKTAAPSDDYDVVATVFALAGHDAATTRTLHPTTRAALDRVWTVQLSDGSWDWPDCDWPPLEHDQYFGVTYVAVACALAPDDYAKTPAAHVGLERIRTYLAKHPSKELHHRMMLIWASTKLPGMIADADRASAIAELRRLQLPDGGWNLPTLGPYPKSRLGKNKLDVSDGYATGFSAFIMRKAGVARTDPSLVKAASWLKQHQRQSGRWFTESVGGSKNRFLVNVGSAYAVMGLAELGEPLALEKPKPVALK